MITRTQPNISSAAFRLAEKADADPKKVWRKILISLTILVTAFVLTVFCVWAIWTDIATSEAEKLLFAFVLLGSLVALFVGSISIVATIVSLVVYQKLQIVEK